MYRLRLTLQEYQLTTNRQFWGFTREVMLSQGAGHGERSLSAHMVAANLSKAQIKQGGVQSANRL